VNERDERWQAQQDALALEEPAEMDPGFGERDEPQWREELDFYASLSEHAMRDAAPAANDEALIEAALAAVPTAGGSKPVARLGLVAAVVALAAVALLWAAWPQETLLRSVERSWTTEAQDVLDAISRRVETAEARAKSEAVHDVVEPPVPAEPEPQEQAEVDGVAPSAPAKRTTPSRPRPDAATLVASARAARGDGRLADAERSYGELLRRFPKSAEARAGRVALAQIKLGRGKAKAALRLFTAAAGGGGPLAEEAAWGRIQALDRLGRKDGLHKAVEKFVRDYPTSVYRARAQGRLDP